MTWDRESIPERLNKLVFHGLYIVGTFLFVLSVAWDAAEQRLADRRAANGARLKPDVGPA